MINPESWNVGKQIIVSASSINHEDDREITLEYLGRGFLQDTSNGNTVSFNETLFPNVYEGMCLSLGLVHNISVCETYKVLRIV